MKRKVLSNFQICISVLLNTFWFTGLFPQSIGQVREQIIPYLIELVRMTVIVGSLVTFMFICNHDWQGVRLKYNKNVHF